MHDASHSPQGGSSNSDGERGRDLLQTLVNLANDAIYVIDPASSRFLDANQLACARLGYTHDELLQRGVIDIEVLLADLASWTRHVDAVRRQGNLLLEGVHRRKDGATFPVEINVAYVTVDRQDYMIAVARDITGRSQADAALRLSEERFRTFVEQASDAIFLHEEGGVILDVNDRACESLGYSREELVGKTLFNIDPLVTNAQLEACQQRLGQGETVTVETIHRRKDGTTFPVEIRMRPFVVDQRLFAVSIVQDITARRRAEETLRTHSQVLHSMAEGVSFIDESGLIVYTNPALDAMFGYAAGELVGRHVTVFNDATPEENAKIVADVHEALKRQAYWRGEFRNRKKDGTVFYTQAHISRVERPGKVFFVSVQEDITERKQAEQQLAMLRDELALLTRLGAIGELAAGIAHEINQPLAAIANFAFAIRSTLEKGVSGQGPAAANCLTMARNLEDQAVRCGDIIRRLRGLIRNHAPVRQPVSLRELALEVAALLSAKLHESGVGLEIDIPSSLPCIEADPLQIQQVMFNLCKNALEAMRLETAERRVRVSASMEGASWLVVRVRDWGPGVPDQLAESLFDMFATSKGEGMGFGLAISRRIIESHQGTLWKSPNVNPGAEFCFSLPVQSDDTKGIYQQENNSY
jgi:PAS domain S-box-containing protein